MSNTTIENKYVAAFDLFEQNLNGNKNSFAHAHRTAALHDFERLGIPAPRAEAWKYTNIHKLLQQDYDLNLNSSPATNGLNYNRFEFLDAYRLVFVDGVFAPALSDAQTTADGVVIGSLQQHIEAEHPQVVAHYNKYAQNNTEALTALNTAYTRDGAFVYAPNNVFEAKPVLLIYLSTESNGQKITQPRNLFIAGNNAGVSIVESYQNLCSTCPAFNNSVTEVVVGDNAKLDLYKLQVQEPELQQVGTVQGRVGRTGRFNGWTFTLGGQFIRNNFTIDMEGEGGEAHLNGMYYLSNDDHVDNHLLINHNTPHCMSNQLYKGLLDGKSTGVFNGKVYVKKDAQQTNAFQSNKNILLSDEATINTKPELEIYADDVKCSHGATTGQQDEQMLFYLRARGLDKEQASGILNQAFVGEVLETVELPELKDWLIKTVGQKFNMEDL